MRESDWMADRFDIDGEYNVVVEFGKFAGMPLSSVPSWWRQWMFNVLTEEPGLNEAELNLAEDLANSLGEDFYYEDFI